MPYLYMAAMVYPVKTPFWFRWAYPHAIWRMNPSYPSVYLTFDDGPHPDITPWILDMLERYNAKASFFCIGNNVAKHPETFQQLLHRGHTIGNHTFDHCNGWKTSTGAYIESIGKADQLFTSGYFRPPYGRMTPRQGSALRKGFPQLQLVMWDVLSGDFDEKVDGQRCGRRVIGHARAGSIVVFHDSEKAYPRLKTALPMVLEYLSKIRYRCNGLP